MKTSTFVALLALIFCVVAGFIWFVFAVQKQAHDKEYLRKLNWFEAHHCKHDGYLATRYPTRLYRCDDGAVYVWRDIPELP